MTALRGLSVRLGSIREGRKSVLYVSEGFQAMLPPQLRNADASMGKFGNPAANSPMVGENDPREQTAQVFAQSDLYSQLRKSSSPRRATTPPFTPSIPAARHQRVRHRRERWDRSRTSDAAGLHRHASCRSPTKPTAARSSGATTWQEDSSRRCRIQPPIT
jgi:hypothetical protein